MAPAPTIPEQHQLADGIVRYTTVLSGDASIAADVLDRILKADSTKLRDLHDTHRRLRLLLSKIRSLLPAAQSDAQPTPHPLATLAEPARSAFLLHALEILPSTELAAVLGHKPTELARLVEEGENAWRATRAMRAAGGETNESDVGLKRELGLLPVSADSVASLAKVLGGHDHSQFSWHRLWHEPAAIAVAFGVLCVLGFAFWQWHLRQATFTGVESVEQMLEEIAGMSGDEMEEVNLKPELLVDWLAMEGLEEFTIPPEFSHCTVVGRRISKVNGMPVCQLALKESPKRLILLQFFRVADFGVRIEPDDTWKIVENPPWVAAVRERNGVGTLVALQGSAARLQEFLTAKSVP